MKREVMLKAWEMYRKGFKTTFAECLKGAWELVKKVNKFYKETNLSMEKLDVFMKENKEFRHKVNKSNLANNATYPREKAGHMTFSLKLWVKQGIARVYADKFIDGTFLTQSYVEAR